jgi:hypothetical protein
MARASTNARSVLKGLKLHPRVAYQSLYPDDKARHRLLGNVPELVPFGKPYHGAIVILDWDHLLPSKKLPLRVFIYYDADSLAEGETAFDDRIEEIGQRDKFPEFDVPDFGDLPADEAYEAEVDEHGDVSGCRLTSAWRRSVALEDARNAVGIARGSAEFARVAENVKDRPRYLGDLDAVSWTPPCESGHARWTLDVWYLLAFDGRVGTGRSLLVDLQDRRVVAVRDFSVRTG